MWGGRGWGSLWPAYCGQWQTLGPKLNQNPSPALMEEGTYVIPSYPPVGPSPLRWCIGPALASLGIARMLYLSDPPFIPMEGLESLKGRTWDLDASELSCLVNISLWQQQQQKMEWSYLNKWRSLQSWERRKDHLTASVYRASLYSKGGSSGRGEDWKKCSGHHFL